LAELSIEALIASKLGTCYNLWCNLFQHN